MIKEEVMDDEFDVSIAETVSTNDFVVHNNNCVFIPELLHVDSSVFNEIIVVGNTQKCSTFTDLYKFAFLENRTLHKTGQWTVISASDGGAQLMRHELGKLGNLEKCYCSRPVAFFTVTDQAPIYLQAERQLPNLPSNTDLIFTICEYSDLILILEKHRAICSTSGDVLDWLREYGWQNRSGIFEEIPQVRPSKALTDSLQENIDSAQVVPIPDNVREDSLSEPTTSDDSASVPTKRRRVTEVYEKENAYQLQTSFKETERALERKAYCSVVSIEITDIKEYPDSHRLRRLHTDHVNHLLSLMKSGQFNQRLSELSVNYEGSGIFNGKLDRGDNFFVIDGSHRLAAAHLYNQSVPAERQIKEFMCRVYIHLTSVEIATFACINERREKNKQPFNTFEVASTLRRRIQSFEKR